MVEVKAHKWTHWRENGMISPLVSPRTMFRDHVLYVTSTPRLRASIFDAVVGSMVSIEVSRRACDSVQVVICHDRIVISIAINMFKAPA